MYKFKENDRVYAYDLDNKKHYGTIHKNTEFPSVSEWYVKYDDGKECAVVDVNSVFLVNQNIYKPFQKGYKFGIENTSSKYPEQNKLKVFFRTEEGAQEYCDFLMEKEKTNRTVGRLKRGGNNAEGPVHLFLNLTEFKPKNL